MTDQHSKTPSDPGEALLPAERAMELVKLLDVEPVVAGMFRGRRKPGGVGRVYGGQVVAQALVAASKTVSEDRLVHSLHAYFLRGAKGDHAIDFRVESDFDGASFSNRRVIAMQQGKVLFNLAVSFSRGSRGHHHQPTMPVVPAPEDLDPIEIAVRRFDDSPQKDNWNFYAPHSPIELRSVGALPYMSSDDKFPGITFWFRVASPLAEPQWMHRAILAYASDLGMIAAAAKPHIPFDIQVASMDHSLWFHRDVRSDDWLLCVIDSPWAGEGRGLAQAAIYDREGNLVANASQESMIRDRAMRGENC